MHCDICLPILRIFSQRKTAIGTTGGGRQPQLQRGLSPAPRVGSRVPSRESGSDLLADVAQGTGLWVNMATFTAHVMLQHDDDIHEHEELPLEFGNQLFSHELC